MRDVEFHIVGGAKSLF